MRTGRGTEKKGIIIIVVLKLTVKTLSEFNTHSLYYSVTQKSSKGKKTYVLPVKIIRTSSM